MMETEPTNFNIWNMLSSATAGILGPHCSERPICESNMSLHTNSEDNVQCLAPVVNLTPVEGEDVIKRISSDEYKPQICIESGDYVTIVYKKCFPQSENLKNATIGDKNSPIHVDETISIFSANDSYPTKNDSLKNDWDPKSVQTASDQGRSSLLDGSEAEYTCQSFYLEDLYVTAMENCSTEGKTSVHPFEHLVQDESLHSTTSTSVVCGCNANSHSRTSCPNTTKFDISLEGNEIIPASYEEFCTELHSTGSSIRNKKYPGVESKEKLERTNSVNRRNKRFLDFPKKKFLNE